MTQNKNVLTIAGSDSSGGAGIQADLKAFQALGTYGLSVITALTAQNTQGVKSIQAVSAAFVQEQLEAVLEDIVIDSVKIGMVHSTQIIECIAKILAKYKIKKIILDPVMISKSGSYLLQSDSIQALKEDLIPLCSLITPNIPEAECLTGIKIISLETQYEAGKSLLQYGCDVLIKGGHSSDHTTVKDIFISQDTEEKVIAYPRIETLNTHGTGCTYSSAIAAYFAQEENLLNAVEKARFYLQGAIQSAKFQKIGCGFGPVDHMWMAKGKGK